MGKIRDFFSSFRLPFSDFQSPEKKPNRQNVRDPNRSQGLYDLTLDLAFDCAIAQENGLFRLPAQVFKAIDRDDRVHSCLNTRELAVQGLNQIYLDPIDNTANVRARKALERDWPHIFPKSMQGEIIRNVAVEGFAVCRINNWELPTPSIHIWDPWYLTWSFDLNCFTAEAEWWDKGQKRQGQVPVIPGDGNWVLFTGRNKTKPYMGGLIRVLPQLVAHRQGNIIDWGRHGKIWGNPPKVIESMNVPATKTQDFKKLAEAMAELVGDSTITLPNGASIKLLELSRDAYRVFQAFGPDFLDDCIAICVLGQNLTTRVTGGSFAAAQAHQFVRLDYMKGDAESLGSTAHRQIVYPYYCYKHDIWDFNQVPQPKWDAEPPPDKKTVSEAAKSMGDAYLALATGIQALRKEGIFVDREIVCEEFGIPYEKIGEWAEDVNKTLAQVEPNKPMLPPKQEDSEE